MDFPQAADGTVEMGRVCGNLAVSRSLGDYVYKDMPSLPQQAQKISAEADVSIVERHVCKAATCPACSCCLVLWETPLTRLAECFLMGQPDDEFLLVACDGIYDVLSNEAAINFISNQLKASRSRLGGWDPWSLFVGGGVCVVVFAAAACCR
jgi:serine/threonine protein phosphatase PrpC